MTNIAREVLDEKTIDRDPIKQFQLWFNDAFAAGLPLPEAMTLATATPDGKPSARMVLLKQVDHDGFVFYTNYRSAKAEQLDANPYAALVFYWAKLDRQVRVEGSVVRTSAQESRDYFKTRPRESQIGAWASPQSEAISSRDVLEQRRQELGIRVTLGARTADVLGLVLRHGVRVTGAGIAAGVVGGLALSRVIERLLFGVSSTDPLTFAAAALVLGAAGLLACWIPAREATKVDPLVALRH